jgi:hypothetical protein
VQAKKRPGARPGLPGDVAYFVTLPLVLPLTEPLVEPVPAEPGRSMLELLELDAPRSLSGVLADELELSRPGVLTLMSALVLLEERSAFAPDDAFASGAVVDEDDELAAGGFAGGVTVVEDDDVLGRVPAPVLAFRLSPHALSAVATAATMISFANVLFI